MMVEIMALDAEYLGYIIVCYLMAPVQLWASYLSFLIYKIGVDCMHLWL